MSLPGAGGGDTAVEDKALACCCDGRTLVWLTDGPTNVPRHVPPRSSSSPARRTHPPLRNNDSTKRVAQPGGSAVPPNAAFGPKRVVFRHKEVVAFATESVTRVSCPLWEVLRSPRPVSPPLSRGLGASWLSGHGEGDDAKKNEVLYRLEKDSRSAPTGIVEGLQCNAEKKSGMRGRLVGGGGSSVSV